MYCGYNRAICIELLKLKRNLSLEHKSTIISWRISIFSPRNGAIHDMLGSTYTGFGKI